MKVGVLIAVIIISVAGKNLWPVLYPLFYFQTSAIAWVLLSGLCVYLMQERGWPRKLALILFWWAVNDVVEMCFADRIAFNLNEYICAAITVIIILSRRDNGRKKRVRRIRNTSGYAA